MFISVLVGNPRAGSRTLQVAETLAEEITSMVNAERRPTVDLALYAHHIFDWPSDVMAALNDAVATSDLIIVASPTYKATYTGLLKSFLDRYPNCGLAGVTAIPVMTGASPLHAMAVDTGLRPLLVELGASVPTRGMYFQMSRMASLQEDIRSWVAENVRPGGVLTTVSRGDLGEK
jgi:FMN reductase